MQTIKMNKHFLLFIYALFYLSILFAQKSQYNGINEKLIGSWSGKTKIFFRKVKYILEFDSGNRLKIFVEREREPDLKFETNY